LHELSIADAIVATACRHADGRRVTRVELKVGHLRQVVAGSLEFAFELVAHGTPVEGAALQIEEVPARVACRQCAAESRTKEFPLTCAGCGSLHVDVVAGDELFVDALELEDEPIAVARR
jgi:hydrogenase nickel incorporation protein HypA/HybF